MSDEMDVLFDHRLRNALHGTSLPPAPASLRVALEDLPRTAGGTTARSVPRRTAGAALAAGLAAVAVLGGAAIFGLGGFGPAGERDADAEPIRIGIAEPDAIAVVGDVRRPDPGTDSRKARGRHPRQRTDRRLGLLQRDTFPRRPPLEPPAGESPRTMR